MSVDELPDTHDGASLFSCIDNLMQPSFLMRSSAMGILWV